MAKTIIIKPAEQFTIECERCDCVFTYTLEDLMDDDYVFCVACPACGRMCSHLLHKKFRNLPCGEV